MTQMEKNIQIMAVEYMMIKAIIYLCEEKLFFFKYACFIYERNNYYRYFRYLFYKKSIELDTNLFAFFPEIWIRTIKGLFEYFKSSI